MMRKRENNNTAEMKTHTFINNIYTTRLRHIQKFGIYSWVYCVHTAGYWYRLTELYYIDNGRKRPNKQQFRTHPNWLCAREKKRIFGFFGVRYTHHMNNYIYFLWVHAIRSAATAAVYCALTLMHVSVSLSNARNTHIKRRLNDNNETAMMMMTMSVFTGSHSLARALTHTHRTEWSFGIEGRPIQTNRTQHTPLTENLEKEWSLFRSHHIEKCTCAIGLIGETVYLGPRKYRTAWRKKANRNWLTERERDQHPYSSMHG